MDFTEIDFAEFKQAINELKSEIEAERKKNPNIDDESLILVEAINILNHELKDENLSYLDFDLEKKRRILPSLSLVFFMTRSFLGDDESFDDEDWDFLDEAEEDCQEDESCHKELPQVKSHPCCGHDHSHHSANHGKHKK